MKKHGVLGVLAIAGIIFFSGMAQADLSDGLVAYYPFNGNGNDESGNGNDGTVYGATLAVDRLGNVDSAYRFDGDDDYINIPHSSELNLTTITMSTWVKVFTVSEANMCIHKWTEGYWNSWNYGLGVLSDGKAWVSFKNSVPEVTQVGLSGLTNITDGQWHHIVGVISGGSYLEIYIDGVQENSDSITHMPTTNSNPVRFGKTQDSINYFSTPDGIVDDIRIYNRALSESEIQELYNEGDNSDDRYDEGYNAGRQACIDDPASCGIIVNGGYTQAELDAKYQEGCEACSNSHGTPATISPELNMHIPILQYQTLLGNISLWADFEFAGESNGDMLWKLSDFGEK